MKLLKIVAEIREGFTDVLEADIFVAIRLAKIFCKRFLKTTKDFSRINKLKINLLHKNKNIFVVSFLSEDYFGAMLFVTKLSKALENKIGWFKVGVKEQGFKYDVLFSRE